MHRTLEPAILYFGAPVALISTLNPDGTANLAPMSSIFWLGWRAMIGLDARSQTTLNLQRTGECAVNLPDAGMAASVDRLALTTGASPVPEDKKRRGYRFHANKFGLANLTPAPSQTIQTPVVRECPVQMEASVEATRQWAADDAVLCGRILCFELRIRRVHVDESLLLNGFENRIDPDKWRPLIMSFQQFYGLGLKVGQSTLAQTPEILYRSPDIDRGRRETRQ